MSYFSQNEIKKSIKVMNNFGRHMTHKQRKLSKRKIRKFCPLNRYQMNQLTLKTQEMVNNPVDWNDLAVS